MELGSNNNLALHDLCPIFFSLNNHSTLIGEEGEGGMVFSFSVAIPTFAPLSQPALVSLWSRHSAPNGTQNINSTRPPSSGQFSNFLKHCHPPPPHPPLPQLPILYFELELEGYKKLSHFRKFKVLYCSFITSIAKTN